MSTLNVAVDVVKMIKNRGFKADVVINESNELSVSQRLLKIEEISQSKNCKIGIRAVTKDNRCACISSNDLSDINLLVDRVIDMAKSAPEDQHISFADSEEFNNSHNKNLDLMILDRSNISIDELKKFIQVAENSALSYDSNITNSEGASFSHSVGTTFLATSNGFVDSYSKSIFSSYVSVIAGKDSNMEVGYDYTTACNFEDLKKPEILGREAADRALKRLNPSKIKTCKVPVIIENRIAGTLLKNFATSVKGDNIANGTSFLINHLNKKVFNDNINIIDDSLMIKGISSRPFDGEGIPSHKNTVVKNGIIQNWVLDIYSANQLGLKTTGNAVRNGNASVKPGVSNFYIENGNISPQSLIAEIKNGLYITDLFGFGVNLITGDYSQGVSGFWIENGEIAYSVHELTIADNLLNMFANMSVANDLKFLSSVNSPTLKISEMTVAGMSS